MKTRVCLKDFVNDGSLFYNTSADTSDTSADTSDTSATRVRHECYTNGRSATRVKNFDFDNDASENIFSDFYIYYMTSERLQREEQFHSKNFFLEMPRSPAKMRLKSAPQKLNF